MTELNTIGFDDVLTPRPKPRGIAVVTKLIHFSIITYLVNPEVLRKLIPKIFDLELIETEQGPRALVSVVPFFDKDFTSAVFPFPKSSFGQTNYRAYIIDPKTKKRSVWFFGTVLDSITVAIPRYVWKIPWHRGYLKFDCDLVDGLYRKYQIETKSKWAPASLKLSQRPEDEMKHPGFPNEEAALAILTHPLDGYFNLRNGGIGSYSVWHDKLEVRPGRCEHARFELLDRLGLVTPAEQETPYSVLIQPETEFTIYLPPKRISN